MSGSPPTATVELMSRFGSFVPDSKVLDLKNWSLYAHVIDAMRASF